jgi:glyoxylase-like metal-dependent hydrolase (beta-lactamase superfamily II)
MRHAVPAWLLCAASIFPALESADTHAQPAAQSETLPVPVLGHEVTKLGPGYFTFRYTGTRNIFLITEEGVIVTDPISPEAARVMREEIARLTDLPVRYVVYSHDHWDHVLGAAIFVEEGAQVISHEHCLRNFYDLPHPDLVKPDWTISGDHDLVLGERTLQLRYLGRNHGDCLIIMTPDHVNIPFIVDLATAGGMPLPFIPDYSLHNWVRSLAILESWDWQEYVGGHGLAPTPKALLAERRHYLQALIRETRQRLDDGVALDAIPGQVRDSLRTEFGHLRNFETYAPYNAQRVITYFGMGW